jgi:hypothetical protein
MLGRARRPLASLCMVALALDVGGCTRVRRRETGAVIRPGESGQVRERIVGVTLTDGREVRFDAQTPAIVRGDSLHSHVARQVYGVPLAEVQRVWVESVDPVRSTFAVIGITAGVLVAAVAVAIATKESCPFVYSWDGTRYVFDAEPYGGAVTRGLERDDYGDLEHLRPDSAGFYRLLVTNEVNETQYTNAMRLLVVDHRPGSRFEMDEFGRLYAVASAVAPTSARDQAGRDLTAWLRATDQLIWEPLPPERAGAPVRQEIVLTFPKPRGAKRARLVARAGTGMWGSHMIRELLDLRGSAVRDWYAAVDGDRAAQDSLRLWNVREELYVLKVDVEEAGGWRSRGLLPGGGPFITETRVVPLDVSAAAGDSLRLRIRPPAGFWALNSFAVSYDDAERPLAVDTVAPLAARTSDGRDVLPDLAAPDDRNYAMPTTSDRATVSFRAPAPRAGAQRTVFLHTRGYYRLYLDERGQPDVAALQRITDEPDAAARMAAERFARRRVAAGGAR